MSDTAPAVVQFPAERAEAPKDRALTDGFLTPCPPADSGAYFGGAAA